MNNNFLYLLQSITIEQLKKEIDDNCFTDKKLKDFEKGKNLIDSLIAIRNIDQNVQDALLLYAIYKIKGGK